ncbi:hypothetical protein [Paraglaciecola sp. MB-3u-78]|uniref:hypothetical protein n=1 Tax=Paraglaciecola sp. MB-3u-78 TaxID=2058332 RepID=UPI000C329BBF|nr:hypothetical protein [Paraglaciecola sp. MB-3u-78]PKH00311.1 hypothetical protein CXF95_05350 [Paraglaciecola sp. MB-3u-78]
MKTIIFTLVAVLLSAIFAPSSKASENALDAPLSDLKNYHVDTPNMVSSGMPNQGHFETLKALGVTKVIDLLPGDRKEESSLMNELNLTYYNIQVEWDNPTIENFREYILTMKQFNKSEGITLTHCRLNWRGAVFTYLYRVTQLKESAELAKEDMLAIWVPNEIWQGFIDVVISKY